MSEKPTTKCLIRFPEVQRRTGIDSRQHAQKLARIGKFPPHVTVGVRAVAWVQDEIDAWVEQRIAERQVPGKQTAAA